MTSRLLIIGLMLFQMAAAPIQLLAGGFVASPTVTASSGIRISNNQAQIEFPAKITFEVDLESSVDIQEVVLEYGVEQLTCGKLVAKSYPDFTPGKKVSINWSWEMKQSGSLPPGAKIWWRWSATDASGATLTSDEQKVTWIDNTHPWKSLTASKITLHWYSGDSAFGKDLLNTAVNSLDYLNKNLGLKSDDMIDLYIYANSQDLSETVYFQPDWTGGLAYPENDIVLIGISPDVLVWGKHAETHELTHVLVGHLTFSCLGDLPTWLSEGLAKWSEGEWDQDSQAQLKEAIASDDLISVRSLSSSFPEDSTKANLAYTQSQSLVTFLINEYKQEKMLKFLGILRDGTTADEALKQVYGFDQEGLEDAWRAKMGAKARSAVAVTPTPLSDPTPVPTIVPISGVPPVVTLGPTSSVPETATETAPLIPGGSSSLFGGGTVALVCGSILCLLLVIAIIVAVIFFARKQGKERTNS